MIKIPVDIEANKVAEFLDYLRLEIQFESGSQGEGSFKENGRFEEKVTGRLKGSRSEDGKVLFTITWNPDGTLAPICAEVDGKPPTNWEALVQGWVHQALVGTVNAQRERFFFNYSLAYMGALLDGEYYVSGFRLAPALYPDETAIWNERIVYLGLHAEGVDQQQAHELGRVEANRLTALLSCFLTTGFYSIPIEKRWILMGAGQSARYQLGFRKKDPPPDVMPKKGQLCPLGKFKAVDRSQLRIPCIEKRLQLPADIRELFRKYRNLATGEKEAFLGAASLYRVALTAGRRYPTVRMAYEVAAVDALLRGNEHTQDAFVKLVQDLCPEAPEDILRHSYGSIRSAHFHGGEFPGGEYQPFHCGFFYGPQQLERMNLPHAVGTIMWNALIRWLLLRT
ncbi:MAG: hypothetical protein JRJ47_08065 [Deltaproteobacteria bacterium]|nr:hypothetical protein [Deltaproteobacteria bacterium]